MSEPEEGSIYCINGFDCLQLGLHTLRRQFTVISQSPFLFDGTLRENLDTEGIYEDKVLWEALRKTNLFEYISSLPDQLDTEISQSKVVLSVG